MVGGLREVEGRSRVDVVRCEDGRVMVAVVVAVTGVHAAGKVAAVVLLLT